MRNRWLTVLLLGISTAAAAHAQDPTPTGGSEQALRVFLDCRRCDFDHFRREAAFVNYVRDRRDAQVHVLVTSQQTGGGGRAYTFDFIGLDEFAGRVDTLVYRSRQTDIEDEVRDGLLRTFTLGLMPFVAGTPLANRISISYESAEQGEMQQRPADDPWNLWVFRIGGNGRVRGESSERSYSVGGSVSARRTTEDWRIELASNGRYNEDRFELDSSETFVSTSKNFNAEFGIARSLGQHWAFGTQINVNSSTRFNRDLAVSAGPAIEFSIFPYMESTRRQVTLFYRLFVTRIDYEAITIFDKTEETRLQQELILSAQAVQPWGSIHTFGEASFYLHDLARHRLEIGGGFEIRIVRGLNFNMFGEVARIKDQIYLSAADIPEEDILLRRRQLGTDFEVFLNFGFSYTFGSIFNNVVNPRMDEIF